MILSQGLVLERKKPSGHPAKPILPDPFLSSFATSSLERFGISTLADTALGFRAIIASVLEKS